MAIISPITVIPMSRKISWNTKNKKQASPSSTVQTFFFLYCFSVFWIPFNKSTLPSAIFVHLSILLSTLWLFSLGRLISLIIIMIVHPYWRTQTHTHKSQAKENAKMEGKMGRPPVTYEAMFLPHYEVICDLLLIHRSTALWNLIVLFLFISILIWLTWQKPFKN